MNTLISLSTGSGTAALVPPYNFTLCRIERNKKSMNTLVLLSTRVEQAQRFHQILRIYPETCTIQKLLANHFCVLGGYGVVVQMVSYKRKGRRENTKNFATSALNTR